MKIISVVGTRPNFIKIAPLINEVKKHPEIKHVLVHTGQHYDREMSKLFFDDLEIPKPDVNLRVGSASDVTQTANIVRESENIILKEKPDLVVVVGDVNSTLAAALTAVKCNIQVAHVEAGLRSFDRAMPEELNRILTDHVSDFLFTTEESANRNLANEGISKSKIFFAGNLMIDSLSSHREKAKKSKILSKLKLEQNNYSVLTLHRPSNVDDKESLKRVISILSGIQQKTKIVFPMHPRTMKNLRNFNLFDKIKNQKNIVLTEPLGYLDFLSLMSNSRFVLTDSGGIQEETTVLGIPCITLRNNTERPVTVEHGTNVLVSTDKAKITEASNKLLKGTNFKAKIPRFWDGKAAKRIVDIIIKDFN
ncbi:UDP-N-acetylglucosamine 2-epimerase (non-hydrolyzing) [Candidatus Woesearchaeota archaeon]|nr:UDP-N-acetylglucosamine 2-epimerase (non-hydrolyzing) [Candidatus Woesearchaeota archaeon]